MILLLLFLGAIHIKFEFSSKKTFSSYWNSIFSICEPPL